MTPHLHRMAAAAAALIAGIAAQAAPVKVTAQLDSAYILMGKTATVTLQLVQARGTHGTFVNPLRDTLCTGVEIARLQEPDTSALGNDREEITRQITVQSFDSGLYAIPPFRYAAGGDTFASAPLALKVVPADVDSMTSVHDFAPVAKPHTRFYDYLPDFVADYWWVLAMLLLAALGALVYFRKIRPRALKAAPQPEKLLPPYELAMQRLGSLKARKLCESGHEKEYYTILTEILRNYLDSRFGINAMEMTSPQILDTLRSNPDTRPSAPVMRQILAMADFVKFAKVRPLPDENLTAFNNAVKFVEDTRPADNPAKDPADEEPKQQLKDSEK